MTITETREYPKIYAEFERTPKNGSKPRKYWIQDAPEEFFDQIVDHLINDFPREEPISKYKKGYEDKISSSEVRIFANEILQSKISLACLTKNDQGETKLAGFNALMIAKKDEDDDFKSKGWFLPFMISIFEYLDEQRNIFDEFGIDECLKAVGLFVLPEYRGEGLGEQILKARMPLCKSLGIKVTSTTFTATASQKAAYKAGFEDYFSIDYEELFKLKPEFYIPGIHEHTKTLKVLYKVIN